MRHTKSVSGIVVLIAAATIFPVMAQEAPSRVVSNDWLQANLTQENLRIIDARSSIMDYWKGHVPGAVYLSADALRWPEAGVPAKLAPPEALVMLLGQLGVTPDTYVVVYGDKGDPKAPYILWALDYLGHEKSAILDGWFGEWQSEGRPVTQDYPSIEPAYYPLPDEHPEVRATLSDVKDAMGSQSVITLDVRPAPLYAGEQGPWKRKGHIPSAVNHLWSEDLNEDGTWKAASDLRAVYESLGATPDKMVIVSCGQGLMSAETYVTLKYILGYPNVKNYDGGFSEWSSDPALPVATTP
jgi:thiosulfate/3-mercaptopyruvate sulfurtransferase